MSEYSLEVDSSSSIFKQWDNACSCTAAKYKWYPSLGCRGDSRKDVEGRMLDSQQLKGKDGVEERKILLLS